MTILGIPSDRIESVSYGKEKPKATGHDESSWSENRRSDIVYR
jgi:peptidoglycan-associated lipoprotein